MNAVDLMINPKYYFTASPDDQTHRFNLKFMSAPLGNDETITTGDSISIYSYANVVCINKPENSEGDVVICDLAGKEIQRTGSGRGTVYRITLNSGPGCYLVKFIDGNQILSEKVMIGIR